MKRNEYEALKAKAKAEFDRDIEAIERVWQLSGEARDESQSDSVVPESASTTVQPAQAQTDLGGNGQVSAIQGDSIVARIRRVIHSLPRDRFTIHDMTSALPDVNSVTISTTLKRLSGSNEIRVARQGAGRRATIYHRPCP